MRLNPEQRREIGNAVRKGVNKSILAVIYCVSIATIWFWGKQDLRTNLSDLPRNTKTSKITVEVELSILARRIVCKWGTAGIQQGLMNLPDFMISKIGVLVQEIPLSRDSINNVLKEHKINGYRREKKSWKFFRAKYQNELWQLDLKGPFRVQGKKYWIVVCIDDYSRYLLLLKLFDHQPRLEEIETSISSLIKKYHPEKILTDNNPFSKTWESWCRSQKIEAVFAHPYYPQDKGKVERTIRTLTEEFIVLLNIFQNGLTESWKNGKNGITQNDSIEGLKHILLFYFFLSWKPYLTHKQKAI